jgi:hypothetical protein
MWSAATILKISSQVAAIATTTTTGSAVTMHITMTNTILVATTSLRMTIALQSRVMME